MRQIRIYTPQTLTPGQELKLDARARKHLVQVLRKRAGDRVTLFNGDGNDAQAVIAESSTKAECLVRIDSAEAVQTESALQITLIQAVARGDKMDWVVQKAVELGVAEILPVWTERTEIKLDAARAAKRQQRWQDIAISACEQSQRSIVPKVHLPSALSTIQPRFPSQTVFLHPASGRSLQSLGWQTESKLEPALVIGPEGGFSDAEVEWLVSAGCIDVQVGPRVLRTETAGPAALAALQCLYGDWN